MTVPTTGTVPRFDASRVSQLCDQGNRLLITTGLLRLWLVGHFQQANLEDQDQTIQKMLWSPQATSGILIESITRWRPEMTEKRPGVIIKRNGWKRLRLGIADRMMGTVESTGQEVYGNFWQGSHTLFCIAGNGAEAEKLATEVFRELNQFGPKFRLAVDLMRFEVTEVGELLLLEEGRQNFVVPIVVAYVSSEAWRVNQETPLLRNLNVTMLHP